MVLRGDVAQLAQFDTAPGASPATPMAIIARIREVMQQASDLGEAAASYAEEPAGRGRVGYDPVLDALATTGRGDQPVRFVVDDSNEAFRALKLSQDTGASVLLAGLANPTARADRMAEEGRPLLLSLDLPDALEDEDADSTASEPPHDATRTFSYESLDAETATLQSKRRAALERVESGARVLDSLGVAFAFALFDMKPGEIHGNLRRLIDAGLPEDAALAALTTDAAALLDLGATMGTVEAGKMANLVVTDGSYFDAESTVQMVFVDGHKFEFATVAPP